MSCTTNAVVVCGLYFLVIVESVTLGMVIDMISKTLVTYLLESPNERDTNGVLVMTIILIGIVIHFVALPCLCYAVHNRSANALIPYMAWRSFLSALSVIVIIWQGKVQAQLSRKYSQAFYTRMFPLTIAEVVLGTFFFIFTLKAHAVFVKDSTAKHYVAPSHRYSQIYY